jgi:hypothetical protein
MVEEPAPIDDVTVTATTATPPGYVANIKSGLPNGCYRFKGFEVDREGATVRITVTNLRPADDQPCNLDYGTVETAVDLGSDFDPDQAYQVDVNGVISDFRSSPAPQRVSQPAPIESVSIAVSGGRPASNDLVVVSALPDSCHEFEAADVQRDGDTIHVAVTNSRLTVPDIACTEIYRTVETRIDLGEDVEVCKGYTVVANGKEHIVQAIAPNVLCRPPDTSTGTAPAPPTLAPIERVDIRTTRSIPAQYSLSIQSGLPNGCVKLEGYSLDRHGSTITIVITNVSTASQGQMCIQVYTTTNTSIALGTDFYRGTEYTVNVNDVTETFEGLNAPLDDTVSYTQVPAPIESMTVMSTRTDPPQYIAAITSGLPNSCVRLDTYNTEREGNRTTVSIMNLAPGPDTICAQVYGTVDTHVALGSDFKSGQEYSVRVNDVTESFTVASAAEQGGEDGAAPRLGEPFQLGVGESATIEAEGLRIEFLEIVEESRCPLDVTCIQAGRAMVRVAVGDEQAVATLEARGMPYLPGETVGAYAVALIALDPYPNLQDGEPATSATLLVTTKPAVSMVLTAAPVEGAARQLRFHARISGGPPNYKPLSCVGFEMDFGDGTVMAALPACAPWSPTVKATRVFTEQYTYLDAGTYDVTLTLGTRPELTATVRVTVE